MSKVIIITGASDGIGAEAARVLAARGHRVAVVGRSPSKTRAVAQDVGSEAHLADFSNLAQVRELARGLAERYPRIDVLVNNAGGMFSERRTVDGHDTTFQVNHLAPFLLTNLLLPQLISSRAAVIQTASQVAKRRGDLNVDDLENSLAFHPIKAYSNAKLENILFTRELHRRYAKQGLAAVCFHPGNVASSFASDTGTAWRFLYQTPLRHVFLITPQQGAQNIVWLADGRPGVDWRPGAYYEKRKIAATNPQADDPALAAELWRRSAAMVELPDDIVRISDQ